MQKPFFVREPYHDIRYNLIAIVADKRPECKKKLKTFKKNRSEIFDLLDEDRVSFVLLMENC